MKQQQARSDGKRRRFFEALSEAYFRPREFELGGRLYIWLGVVWFKRALLKLVTVNPGAHVENAYVLGGRRLEDLIAFEERTRRSELIHLAGLVASLALLLLAFLWAGIGFGVAGVVVFFANFHCFILQRFNRIRIDRLIHSSHSRT